MFKTKGEFIQALKDYNTYKDKLSTLKFEFEREEYNRFSKVKSPLDYDVVGYKDGEQIRSLKTRSYVSDVQRAERNENLDKKLAKLKQEISSYELAIQEVDTQLKVFKEPYRSVLIDRYINNFTYYQLINKYSSMFPAGYPNAVKRYIESGLDIF